MNKHVGIIGASGFLGSHLIPHLLENTNVEITAISPNPEALSVEDSQLENTKGDVFDTNALAKQLDEVDVAYYFVHMMAADGDYYALEQKAAHSFGNAAEKAGINRVIYMSGLGNDADDLSKHLASRHNTGRVLRTYDPLVIEFRASMIIGPGSISFQILKNLVEKLPLLLLPPTTKTRTQPIAVSDMLQYLESAASVDVDNDTIVEVGGPDALSYQSLIEKYAKWSGHTTVTIRLPYLPSSIASWWLNLFNPSGAAKVGRAMVDSFKNEMIVTSDRAKKLFPDIRPGSIEKDFH